MSDVGQKHSGVTANMTKIIFISLKLLGSSSKAFQLNRIILLVASLSH